MSFIWIDNKKYSDKQYTRGSVFSDEQLNYCAASFQKQFEFNKAVKKIDFKFAADTSGFLLLDNQIIFNDNAKTNGDFSIKNKKINEIYYLKDTVEFNGIKKSFFIKAFVQLGSIKYYDFSSGHGGLFIEMKIVFNDGSTQLIESDETWQSRLETCYPYPNVFDSTIEEKSYSKSVLVKNNWNLVEAKIENLKEEEIDFDNSFFINANSRKTFIVDLPFCYAAHYEIEIIGDSLVECVLISREIKKIDSYINSFKATKSTKFRFFDLVSCGGFKLKCVNKGNKDVTVKVHVLHSHYNFKKINSIKTTDRKLNDLFEKCSFAVRNCSQSIMLDSPKHCEPAASCSGDYNIISLVNAFLTGDYNLSKHCLREYSKLLEITGGVNANSSYALIFIKWLKNIYMITGEKEIILDCEKGVKSVLNLYKSFLGDNFLIEKSYNFIFIDWLIVDGINLFAPPKNLGQTATTMFYYDALISASFLYKEVGNIKCSNQCKKLARQVKNGINTLLYNEKLGLYCEGLTSKDDVQPLAINKPKSNGKIYYRKHSNILAAAIGLRNKKDTKAIINKLFKDPLIKDCQVQPYFDHYFFEAIHKADLDKKYAFKLLKEFTKHIKQKDKGLPEGFYKPDSNYVFDHSHAWASTPFYSSIIALSGLTIIEPGFKTIKIKPLKTKFDYSFVIPTPYGDISIKNTNKKITINLPNEIKMI